MANQIHNILHCAFITYRKLVQLDTELHVHIVYSNTIYCEIESSSIHTQPMQLKCNLDLSYVCTPDMY